MFYKIKMISSYSESGYLGCYEDRRNDRVLKGYEVEYDSSMTIQRCVGFCRSNNFFYAGLTRGVSCLCGPERSTYAKFGRVSDSLCIIPCNGDNTESCGGGSTVAIFQGRSLHSLDKKENATRYYRIWTRISQSQRKILYRSRHIGVWDGGGGGAVPCPQNANAFSTSGKLWAIFGQYSHNFFPPKYFVRCN